MQEIAIPMSEMQLVAVIIEYLRWRGVLALRINSGKLVLDGSSGTRHKPRVFRGAPPGTSDIIGCLPNGRFLAIECKTGKNKPTQLQQVFLTMVRASGGIAFVAYSLDDVIAQIEPLLEQELA